MNVTRTVGTAAAVVTGIAAAVVGSPGHAAADVPSGSSAADIVMHLQDEGYIVQFNMPSNKLLSQCTVSGINGLTLMMTSGGLMAMMAPVGSRGTVYVTLNCPQDSND